MQRAGPGMAVGFRLTLLSRSPLLAELRTSGMWRSASTLRRCLGVRGVLGRELLYGLCRWVPDFPWGSSDGFGLWTHYNKQHLTFALKLNT